MKENNNKNFRKAGVVVSTIAIALMLTIGITMAQYQNTHVIKNTMIEPEPPCYECGLRFDGLGDPFNATAEDFFIYICPVITPILNQIIQGYESGNPVGWSLLFPGYNGSISIQSIETEQSWAVSSRIVFSYMDNIPPIEGITGEVTGIAFPSEPPLSEQEIYERAKELSDFCSGGDEPGDWFGDVPDGGSSGGSGGGSGYYCSDVNKKALAMAVLQCFKLSLPVSLGISSFLVSIIVSSIALLTFSLFQVAQILIAFGGYLPQIAWDMARIAHQLWIACLNFFYPIYCEILP